MLFKSRLAFRRHNMENIYYIAIFHKENDGYWVSFPDLPECFTQGETLNDAFKYDDEEYQMMLKELALMEKKREHKKLLWKLKHPYLSKLKIPATSKIFTFFVILIMLQIILFSEKLMMITGDTAALYALIGIAATISVTLLGYFNKSKAENTAGGIQYELAMKDNNEDTPVE